MAPPTRKLRGDEAKRALALAPPFLPPDFLLPAAAFFGACGDGDVGVVCVCVSRSVRLIDRSVHRSTGQLGARSHAVSSSRRSRQTTTTLTDSRRPSKHPQEAHVPWLRDGPSRENLWGAWCVWATRGRVNKPITGKTGWRGRGCGGWRLRAKGRHRIGCRPTAYSNAPEPQPSTPSPYPLPFGPIHGDWIDAG